MTSLFPVTSSHAKSHLPPQGQRSISSFGKPITFAMSLFFEGVSRVTDCGSHFAEDFVEIVLGKLSEHG